MPLQKILCLLDSLSLDGHFKALLCPTPRDQVQKGPTALLGLENVESKNKPIGYLLLYYNIWRWSVT